jgi:23S rRNA (cytidine1920-2'-O)/16S rRNA (cytidine1409-2'-O)-methyltransferase
MDGMNNKKTIRIDQLMVERGFAASRSLAQRLIMAGQVVADGQTILQSSKKVVPNAIIQLKSPPPYVSRGGEKLASALDQFRLDPQGWICADVGASTGGFTDCLLQRGATRVYAIDVGKGILDWKIRNDPRVAVMEDQNARYVKSLPEPIDFVTIDASFISLSILLPVARDWLTAEGQVVALIKPQFEAGRGRVGKGGVVRDSETHRRVLHETLSAAQNIGFRFRGLILSPLKGPAGNIEFLAWWDRTGEPEAWDAIIDELIPV